MVLLWRLSRPFVFLLPPEQAHGLAITALRSGLVRGRPVEDAVLRVCVAGLDFANPLGMAAGFDKDALVPDALLNLGFGFSEVGTLTPLPQAGNPRPRLFRLSADKAVINRMGFNNQGHEAAYRRLAARKRRGIIGINIGANKESANRIGDYVRGIEQFYPVADYFTVNISSPNTPGLRNLQARDSLRELLDAVLGARAACQEKTQRRCPVFLKISPDLSEEGLDDIADVVLSGTLDGLIVSNTTLSRAGLRDRQAGEAGGLSGVPLFERSTIVLAKMRQRLGVQFPLIGVGGLHDAASALEKIRAGADLLQLYSALVYQGVGIANAILRGLVTMCRNDGVGNIGEYRDSTTQQWAARPLLAEK
ncbi:MAG: Dihydroorotate dehydrogenase (quinone) [Candidatus Tokpelaia hoelldobleri]|uniref:Dihydroorotate dehydrogenase (quinone) n=1 Tax=Candidatus Tokpelaia hoelldobleri TaxID=1902579 RepID=A0A1U9JSK2_9HYPH|nr:MAG: Dihydroorotate dehydrogenase (quinone) [Candidatus Tokpelaia hoelldoblerii]